MAELPLAHRRIAVLAEKQYEDLELWYPVYRLREAGAHVDVLGAGSSEFQGKKGTSVKATADISEVSAADFDALVIPGGYAPDHMRRHEAMVALTRDIANDGKPVAFICHAGWMAASAGIVRGRRVTSAPSIRDDLENAGANWVDDEVVTDGNLISSRKPDDLPAFCRTLIEALG